MSQTAINQCVRLEIQQDIAIITVDNPPVNTITAEVRAGLNGAVDKIENTPTLRAVLLLCAGKTYFSGADIGEFYGPPKEEEYKKLFLRIENLPIPVMTAMYGTVMGGGLELALACHYRIAASSTRFMLPEVTLGIIPGAGGTQRMPRLIGIEKTLDMVVNAKAVNTPEAIELGFIDQAWDDKATDQSLESFALNYLHSQLAAKCGPRPTSAKSVPAVANDIITQYKVIAEQKYPHQTAALTAIKAISASRRFPFLEGLDYETSLVSSAKESAECHGYVHLFFAERNTTRIPELPSDIQARPINNVAIIGAGTMGGGIAMCFANAGFPVTLIDASQEGLELGLQKIDSLYESRVKRGRMSADQKQQCMKLIRGNLSLESVAEADLIIEAVYEDMALKQDIFKQCDAYAKENAIIATNTSTLDINKIAAATKRPKNVIGMHFFSPANVMPLLEVVRTDTTSLDTIKTIMSLAKQIRKTPVLAKVCYGFIGNRMMEGYAREAELMVLEGATPERVDNALQGFGMAMGILAVFDMAGVDVGVNVHTVNAHQFPPDPTYYQASKALYDAGRLGQKSGKGFYQYKPGDRTRYTDEEAIAILKQRGEQLGITQRSDHTEEEIIERCIYPLLNEAIQILDEGIAIRASDIDVAWAMGYGFPRFRGGPLFYADKLGLQTLYDGIMKYQNKFGDMHWKPARLLQQLIKEGKTIAQWELKRERAPG